MTPGAVSGKVLDASAVACLIRGRISAITWLEVAGTSGVVLYLPSMALDEVRALRPDADPDLTDLASQPVVLLRDLDAGPAVERLLDDVGMFDPLAGQVVQVARERGWPVLTDDPGRVRRIDPALDVDLL